MQHLLRPGSARRGRQLEHRPDAGTAALGGGAVEIAGGIEDQPGFGPPPVRAVVVEVMQHLFLGGRPGARHKQGRGKDRQHSPQSDGKSLASHGLVPLVGDVEDQLREVNGQPVGVRLLLS